MAFCASVGAAVCFASGTEIAQPLLFTTKTAGNLPDAGHIQGFGNVTF